MQDQTNTVILSSCAIYKTLFSIVTGNDSNIK